MLLFSNYIEHFWSLKLELATNIIRVFNKY